MRRPNGPRIGPSGPDPAAIVVTAALTAFMLAAGWGLLHLFVFIGTEIVGLFI